MDRNNFSAGGHIISQRVALRKESVDRNMLYDTTALMKCQSLSARRAWIEIFVPFDVIRPAIVALRKESVDRNSTSERLHIPSHCRSPQGERG